MKQAQAEAVEELKRGGISSTPEPHVAITIAGRAGHRAAGPGMAARERRFPLVCLVPTLPSWRGDPAPTLYFRHQSHAAQPDAAGDAVELLAPLRNYAFLLSTAGSMAAVGPAQALVLDGEPAAPPGLAVALMAELRSRTLEALRTGSS